MAAGWRLSWRPGGLAVVRGWLGWPAGPANFSILVTYRGAEVYEIMPEIKILESTRM